MEFIHLGRLRTRDTIGWEQRNEHKPDWTASLIPIEGSYGPNKQDRNTREYCEGSSYGRRGMDLGQEGEKREEASQTEA